MSESARDARLDFGKHNALSESEAERSGRKWWQKIKFGDEQRSELADYRGRVVYYTSAPSLPLNMISISRRRSMEDDFEVTEERLGGFAPSKLLVSRLLGEDRVQNSSVWAQVLETTASVLSAR